jgi:predicted DNA-binding transcriptional regulator AlpA
MMNTFPSEVLTVEEFAQKLHVSRATVFAWIKRGALTEGEHFFKLGRVLRFVWSGELLEKLLQGSCGDRPQPVKALAHEKPSPINWGY